MQGNADLPGPSRLGINAPSRLSRLSRTHFRAPSFLLRPSLLASRLSSHRIALTHPSAPNSERPSLENESEERNASERPIHIPRGIERPSAFEKGPAKKPINRDAGDATMRSRPRRTTKQPSRPPGYPRPAPQRRGGTPTTTPA